MASSDQQQIADLTARVEALEKLVERQGALLASLCDSDAADVRAELDVGQRQRTRQRYSHDDLERLAADFIPIAKRYGRNLPDDKTLAGLLGVHIKTFGKWKRDRSNPVGLAYASTVRAFS